MTNYGNTGHRGYKMSKVVDIASMGNVIRVSLACGHGQTWEPYPGYTAEAWAAHIQAGEHPIVVGKTRLRCEEQHS